MKRHESYVSAKNERGITLVALVVTIIVLLILAGVSISMISGEKGIFSKAQTSANKYNAEEAKEKMELILLDKLSKGITEGKVVGSIEKDEEWQYIINCLYADDEVESITPFKTIAQISPVDVTGYSSVLVKLKAYIYEFEIERDMKVTVVGKEELQLKKVSVEDITVDVGQTSKLPVTTTPNIISENLVYESDNENITVDSEGNVTVGAQANLGDTATITVYGSVSKNTRATCTVTVGEFNITKIIKPGDPNCMNATPANNTSKERIEWAFDGSTNTKWCAVYSAYDTYIGYVFNKPTNIYKFEILCGNVNVAFKLEGLKQDGTWERINNESYIIDNTAKTYYVDTDNAYYGYRIRNDYEEAVKKDRNVKQYWHVSGWYVWVLYELQFYCVDV